MSDGAIHERIVRVAKGRNCGHATDGFGTFWEAERKLYLEQVEKSFRARNFLQHVREYSSKIQKEHDIHFRFRPFNSFVEPPAPTTVEDFVREHRSTIRLFKDDKNTHRSSQPSLFEKLVKLVELLEEAKAPTVEAKQGPQVAQIRNFTQLVQRLFGDCESHVKDDFLELSEERVLEVILNTDQVIGQLVEVVHTLEGPLLNEAARSRFGQGCHPHFCASL